MDSCLRCRPCCSGQAAATVRRIDEELEAQLHRMQELERDRLLPGQGLSVTASGSSSMTLSVDGEAIELDHVVAALVYVSAG